MCRMYKNFIFDLDGTLLETLPDIVTAINAALKECGFDYVYDIESGKKLIGDGVANLMHRALKDKDTPENFEAIKGVFMPLYSQYQTKTTKAMKGCVETLSSLKNKGCGLYVCTNKPNHLALEVLDNIFGPNTFDFIKGLKEGEAPKPDKHNVDVIMEGYHLDPKETLFVGDSMTDYNTARNGGLAFCLCVYGYGNYTSEFIEKCDYNIKEPKELLNLAK